MSEPSPGNKSIHAHLLLALGSASVMDFRPGEFRKLCPEHIVQALHHLRDKDQVLCDWLEALGMESARTHHCVEIYQLWQSSGKKIAPTRWGYRSERDLTFYVLNCVREVLNRIRTDGRWAIYSGLYNTVMCMYPPQDEHFLRETGWPFLHGRIGRPYFEFNDDNFTLKCMNPDQGRIIPDILKQKIRQIREEVRSVSVQEKDVRVAYGRNSGKGNWLLMCKWKLDISAPSQAALDVAKIIDKFGYQGMLQTHLSV